MLTETVLSIMLTNILSVTAALPFIAAQHSVAERLLTLAGDGNPPVPLSSRERRLGSSRRPRRRGQDRTEPRTTSPRPPRRQTGQARVVGSC